MHLTENKMQ